MDTSQVSYGGCFVSLEYNHNVKMFVIVFKHLLC